MANFTGMTVKVVLKDPPNVVLHGEVIEVIAGRTLTLQNVIFPFTGERYAHYTVPGPAIADLQIIATESKTVPMPQDQQPADRATSLPHRQASTFVDPAILSYGKSPAPVRQSHVAVEAPTTPIKSILAKAAGKLPEKSSPFVGEARGSLTPNKSRVKDNAPSQRDEQPYLGTQPVYGDADGAHDAGQLNTTAKKKARRSQKKKPASVAPDDPPPIMNVDVSRNGNDMDGGVKRGTGWRQTPLLQPLLQPPTPQNQGSAKKLRRHKDRGGDKEQNGWATEDATDIQDLGDFDFEANHKLFDKKQVFDQLRQGDTTADEDRLVSHNKIHRPGTYGGKNLHPTENVLSPQLGPKGHSNDLDSSSDADTELNLANGRSSSIHSASRVPMKKQPSRQGSTHVDSRPHPLTTSISSDRGLRINRSMTSLSGKTGKAVSSIASPSPRPDRVHSPHSGTSGTRDRAAAMLPQEPRGPHLAVPRTMAPCPVLFPGALDTLEHETISRYGLTQEAITESAARCVAEMAMAMFDGPDTRRVSRANATRTPSMNIDPNSIPVVVIMAGNHTVGARAVAAARHLICRKVKVIVAEGPYDSPENQDLQLRTQTIMLKRLQKGGAAIKRGSWQKAFQYIKTLAGPPAVIIDGVLAGAPYDPNGSPEFREMIDWANRSRAPVLSLACPSGMSGTDGSASLVEGEPLAVRPDAIICLGAPLRGLLLAMMCGERWDDLRLADIGINVALRSDEAVPFGPDWVVQLQYADDRAAGD